MHDVMFVKLICKIRNAVGNHLPVGFFFSSARLSPVSFISVHPRIRRQTVQSGSSEWSHRIQSPRLISRSLSQHLIMEVGHTLILRPGSSVALPSP